MNPLGARRARRNEKPVTFTWMLRLWSNISIILKVDLIWSCDWPTYLTWCGVLLKLQRYFRRKFWENSLLLMWTMVTGGKEALFKNPIQKPWVEMNANKEPSNNDQIIEPWSLIICVVSMANVPPICFRTNFGFLRDDWAIALDGFEDALCFIALLFYEASNLPWGILKKDLWGTRALFVYFLHVCHLTGR